MTKYDSIVFDLDGTLWDTSEACAIGWNNVLQRHGIAFRTITPNDVRKVMGKPHEICIRETFAGLAQEEIELLIAETMTEDNAMVEKLGGCLYEGVELGLQALAKRVPLFIVSNCQTGYIETFIAVHKLDVFQDFECWGNTRKSKAENLASLIARNSLKRPAMIGDMESDRTAARICSVPFLHVAYGFGAVQTCEREFRTFQDLCEYLYGAI